MHHKSKSGGCGKSIEQDNQAGFRFQHLSNADIKRPNPGMNFSRIYFQYEFQERACLPAGVK
jgi:hypothetical protein